MDRIPKRPKVRVLRRHPLLCRARLLGKQDCAGRARETRESAHAKASLLAVRGFLKLPHQPFDLVGEERKNLDLHGWIAIRVAMEPGGIEDWKLSGLHLSVARRTVRIERQTQVSLPSLAAGR
jgi:hypothetical protein